MRQSVIRITTHDTKEVYEYPGNTKQLWEVQLKVSAVNNLGHSYVNDPYATIAVTVFLTRDTLENHGLLPVATKAREAPQPAATAEDLLLELLSTVGVYPAPQEV